MGVTVSTASELDPLATAEAYLLAVRKGEDTERWRNRLADLDVAAVAELRADQAAALTFWLDIYNAAAQDVLPPDAERFESKWRFFRRDVVTVAGTALSLDDVEHGILRGSRSKYGLGYLPRLFPSAFERQIRLDRVDPRIHFALNCGAESCPAIRVYAAADIDEQLARSTAAYLERTVEYDSRDGVVRVPRVCLWFYGDFGRKAGILRMLWEHGILPTDVTPTLRFRSFDWTLEPGRFAIDD